ncbi:MAG: ribonuclease III [Balneolaceae bacterium]
MLKWLKKTFQKKAAEQHSRPEIRERWEHLEKIVGFPIRETTHFEHALRHRSIIDGELYEKHETYERLEFLGDAVLDLVVTEIIFEKFPTQDEGFMTKLRAKVVKGETLAVLAKELELNTVLEVGKRAHGQGIELSKSVLADVFESLVAAVYLTEGYSSAYTFIEGVFAEFLDLDRISVTVDNFKSVLLELSQAQKLPLPLYRVVSESGPGHDKTFRIIVSIGGKDYGTGSGKNKKEAEQIAARQAIELLKSELED